MFVEKAFERLSKNIDVELVFLRCKDTRNWDELRKVVEIILVMDDIELNEFIIEELTERLREYFTELYNGRNRKSS